MNGDSAGLSIPLPGLTRTEVTTSGGGGYPVFVGTAGVRLLPDLLGQLAPSHRYLMIADDTVQDLHGDTLLSRLRAANLKVDPLSFPAGEASKTREEWARLTDALLSLGAGRDSCILALGGGVTGDLAGFVAATFMRGVPVVQLPTSLVAMVDASIGGKTGVDVPEGKNLVGAFHPPKFVLADPSFIGTLPRPERVQGLAEALKHGAIVDIDYLEWIERHVAELLEGTPEATRELVLRSVEIKAEVVSGDEREAGRREILNFGHTLGHALETVTRYTVPHGDAVAIGMVLEARVGEVLGVTEPGTADRILSALEGVGLPIALPEGVDPAELVQLAGRDKKAREGEVRLVLLRRPGEVAREGGWSRSVPHDAMIQAMIPV